jgi:hypothetical protein
MANRTTTVHALDMLTASLKGLRDDIEQGNEKEVAERLVDSVKDREAWLEEREQAAWLSEGGDQEDVPSFRQHVGQTLFGNTVFERNEGLRKKKK